MAVQERVGECSTIPMRDRLAFIVASKTLYSFGLRQVASIIQCHRER